MTDKKFCTPLHGKSLGDWNMSEDDFKELMCYLNLLEAAIIRAAENAEKRMAEEGHRD